MPTSDLALSPNAVETEVVRGDRGLIEAHAEEWRSLCRDGPCDQPFFQPEWVAAYLKSFKPKADLHLITARAHGRMSAVLPITVENKNVLGLKAKRLCGAANIHCCRFDIIHRDAEDTESIQAVWQQLRSLPDWDVIEIPRVPEGGATEKLLRLASADGFIARRRELMRNPYMRLDPDSPGQNFGLSKHFLVNLRRRRRRAQEKFPNIRLRRVETADSESLDTFFRLEASGWKGQRGTAIQCQPDTRAFYSEIAQRMAESRNLCFYFLDFDGRPVAGHFGLAHKGVYYSPKVAYDESFGEFGPGHMLLHEICHDLVQRGFHRFELLGPVLPWKTDWMKESLPIYSYYVFRPGLLGQALFFERFRLRPAARKVLRSNAVSQLFPGKR